MHPHASGQVNQNYADPSLANYQQAYYGAHYARLSETRLQYDPHQVFMFPQAIRPPTAVPTAEVWREGWVTAGRKVTARGLVTAAGGRPFRILVDGSGRALGLGRAQLPGRPASLGWRGGHCASALDRPGVRGGRS